MEKFILLAEPWWVNIFFFIPPAAYYAWKKGLGINKYTLVATAMFGIAFGFVEAAVVVYLRAAVGLLPGYGGTLDEVARLSGTIFQQADILAELPESLLNIELIREAATMVMLVAVAILSIKGFKERWAIFLWTFAAWDIFYYVGLWATVQWPASLITPDVLFLIPVPWYSQVWFPLLISALTMLAVMARTRKSA